MIGNDIIDLKLASRSDRSLSPRFLNKICSTKEIEEINNTLDPQLLVWKFWSLKEATYKAHQRRFNLKRKFNPASFHCSISSKNNAVVQIDEFQYNLNSEITTDYIHSYVESGYIDLGIYSGLKKSRHQIISRVGELLSIPPALIDIKKNENYVPSLVLNRTDKTLPISLSHHGSFTAFLIPLIKS
ncbi:4'-phosphopantetheinyl transferase superfamily protein [Christiangramia sp. SM2212]|uniref:4'-phosphopantetheinyl transferase superfamily protein n=1 Tax=Christiangramia sediminicola TaxID=3073267 RepID=A0ABU1EPG1_9FLAO|nr:4'-phosphopantetheinyl transferase superfamily protein [Christiangramia sp. SM2212]MDR5590276.1 4'-phosphopantetheinyl transferase superfamily protein [Christiangramia sp. SM2212]